MFGNNNNWSNKLLDKVTEYIDTRFEDYRSQIANDLAAGLAALAGLVAIWTLSIITLVFCAFTIALFVGWALSTLLGTLAYILSFLSIAILLFITSYWIFKNKNKLIEQPVEKIMQAALGGEMPSEQNENLTATKVITSPVIDMTEEEEDDYDSDLI